MNLLIGTVAVLGAASSAHAVAIRQITAITGNTVSVPVVQLGSISIAPKCKAPMIPATRGTGCVCPVGTFNRAGTCVPLISPPKPSPAPVAAKVVGLANCPAFAPVAGTSCYVGVKECRYQGTCQKCPEGQPLCSSVIAKCGGTGTKWTISKITPSLSQCPTTSPMIQPQPIIAISPEPRPAPSLVVSPPPLPAPEPILAISPQPLPEPSLMVSPQPQPLIAPIIAGTSQPIIPPETITLDANGNVVCPEAVPVAGARCVATLNPCSYKGSCVACPNGEHLCGGTSATCTNNVWVVRKVEASLLQCPHVDPVPVQLPAPVAIDL